MSAVATLLGLLLVVTFIANYIATTLPNTMGQNDLQHELAVENQVSQLSAQAEAVAAKDAVGAQVSQPLTLGSQGAPPFAGPDGGSLTALLAVANTYGNYPASSVNFTLAGPVVYNPPLGFGLSKASNLPSGCTQTSITLTCPAVNKANKISWNFTATNGAAFVVTLGTGGNLVHLNFSTNRSTIGISGVSGMPLFIQVLGSNNTLSISNNGGGNNPISINITGNYDTIASGSFPGGASTIILHVVGNQDYINGDPASGGNTVYTSFVGSNDTLALVPGDGSTYYTYFTGFNAFNPTSPFCPYGALALSDAVTGYTVANGNSANAHLTQSFNNSTAYPTWGNLTPSSRWAIHYHPVLPFACPYVTAVSVPFSPTGLSGFVVRMQNTYVPVSEVAYDQGAVVFAQPGSLPLFIEPPPISLSKGILTLFAPWFQGTLPGESGTGTADLSLRLLSAESLSFPSNGFAFPSGSQITIKIVTPYAAAWYAYFQASSAFGTYVTCSGSNSACTGFYNPNGLLPLGTVTLTIPSSAVTTFNLLIGEFATSLT